MYRYILYLIFAICLPSNLFAETSFKRIFENFYLGSNSSVCSLHEDKQGYIWAGTSNGLCRFNGLEFERYQADSMQCYVQDIQSEPDGLWVASDRGMKFFSYSDGRFYSCSLTSEGNLEGNKENMSTSICKLVRDEKGLFALDWRGRICKHMGQREFAVCFDDVDTFYGFASYKPGLLIASGANGLWLLSADSARVVSHLAYHSVVMSYRTTVYYDKHNDVGYVGYGIGFKSIAFRIVGNEIRRVDSEGCVPDNLMAVIEYKGKTIFAVDGEGLLLKEGGRMEKISPDNSNLSSDAIYSLFVDSEDNLWMGSYRHGVSLYSEHLGNFKTMTRRNSRLTYDIVTAVVADEEKLYLGLDGGGMEIYDRSTGTSHTYTTANSAIPGNNVLSLIKDGDNLWMGIYTKGLVKYSISKNQFVTYSMTMAGENKNGVENNVWTIADDGHGHIWIGGFSVYVLDKKSGKLKCIQGLDGVQCSAIVCRGHYLWISSTRKGFFKIDTRTCRITRHYDMQSKDIRLPSDRLKYLFMDTDGKIWFSTVASGFYSLDERDGMFKLYTANEGLTDSNVTSIEEDNDGNLWLATSSGLFRMNKQTERFVRFDVKEIEQASYTYNSSTFDGEEMFFGNVSGLVYFNPAQINYRQRYEAVNFTSLRLLNDEKEEFTLLGEECKELTLHYDQNFFTITYSVPEYLFSGRVRFSGWLKNLESGWRDLECSREVTYTNVPPGEYEFHVRCINDNGLWGKPSVFKLIITPPWWRTSWAVCLWVLLALGTAAGSIWLYLHEQKIKYRLQINEIEKSTMKKLNEEKLDFYTYITHELRTPVFLIAAQLEELIETRHSPVQVPLSYLLSMHHSSLKLNKLISRVIDLRKMDSGKLQLNIQRKDVVGFCNELTDDYRRLCRQKEITYTFCCMETEIMLDFDAEKLEIILTNLISNAFKYTKEGGTVTLTVRNREDAVCFAVEDNGIGIAEEMRNTIFENFFRTERGKKQGEGDGMGLSFVKTLVELHGGEIRVESEVNQGSAFLFTIPRKEQESEDCPARTESLLVDDVQPSEPKPVSNPTATHSILLIDDERETVNILERYLSSNFKIYKAYDGEEGLEIAGRELPDIVVCDLMMPRMNGQEFLERMKNDKKLVHIKVIIFTAKNSEEDMLKAFDSGADVYLSKPISLKLLRKRIERLVVQSENAAIISTIATEQKTYTKEEQIFLLRCREIIDDNLCNEEFDVDLMAAKLAMSHSTLYKKIRQMTGNSLIEFINDYKIYKAVQLFRQGASNVEEVSKQCGFRDVKSFRNAFKKNMNQTPKAFIQSL